MKSTQGPSAMIANNSDFLLIYEAIQCNPNGDPDQENKPRMDYQTKTNLVTDTRVKRYIRDYLKSEGQEIFVDMEGDTKVTPEDKLKAVLRRMLADSELMERVFFEEPSYADTMSEILSKKKNDVEAVLSELAKKKSEFRNLNSFVLAYLIKNQFIDIRFFGSAFAVPGFTKAYTGAIQLNWGYSLNEVELMESNSIVTTMADDSSTFGKDYRVHYSLLAFNGTINKFAAKSTGLTTNDRQAFRDAIFAGVSALPTRSKLNQYAKVYLEVVYKDGVSNGQFGDLRSYVDVVPKEGKSFKEVRRSGDLTIDFKRLTHLLRENQGENGIIEEVYIHTSPDFDFVKAELTSNG